MTSRTTLNLGILAHVDAGKTSLTERLLHAVGVVDEPGRVDDGTTRTDTLELERRRGITIASAVVAFRLGDIAVNLIDTPGHPDFIAEVERVLGVLDGAVLVVSAVEGVQAQTRILMRALRRLGVPTLIFVNKVDRAGADCARVLRGITGKLTAGAVAMCAVSGEGCRDATVRPLGESLVDSAAEVLTRYDDALLASYVESPLTGALVSAALARQTAGAGVHPVYAGSAMTGAGLPELLAGIRDLLPAGAADTGARPSGVVFKVGRGAAGERIAYLRMFTGTVRVRDRLPLGGRAAQRVTGIEVFADGTSLRSATLRAGQIGLLRGPEDVRIADTFGDPPVPAHRFAPPTLETVVAPVDASQRGRVRAALARLAEADPLIGLRQDNVRHELSVSLYGEVQKEVLQATLAEEFGLAVEFRETRTICVERPAGTGAAVEFLGAGNPFFATIGLRVQPGDGAEFRLEVELGSLPAAFFRAIEDTVHETLRQGLRGWDVRDCTVTVTHSGYASPVSTAADFRNLTPLVLMAALRRAGTVVCEPVHRFTVDLPRDALAGVSAALAGLRAVPHGTVTRGDECTVDGEIPAASVHALHRRLPGLSGGEGVLETGFDRYVPVTGVVPVRPRTDANPLDRREYLLRVAGTM